MLLLMPSGPPTTAADALAWAQEAMTCTPRRYLLDTHVYIRMRDRNMSDRSIWYAIKNATRCVPYVPDRGRLTDGTAWRISGPDHEGEETSVGVETFIDHLGCRLMIITVF
jgi:hypothetical protein